MKIFKRLPTTSLANVHNILCPARNKSIDLHSPALEVFTDFNTTWPLMIEQGTGIEAAREAMKRTHVRLHLVIDQDEHFKGIITLSDLLSVKVMRARVRTGLGVDDLGVVDVMTRREALHAIEYKLFCNARVGDILATMETYGHQHALVVDSEHDQVRGIVSSSDIARALHVPVNINERATSFSDIYQAMRC